MFLKWIKLILTSTVLFYTICFFIVWKMLDFPKARSNAVAETMSRYGPPLLYFKDLVYKTKDYDRFKLHWCVDYHRKVAEYFEYQKSESYAMMAFCYDRLGEKAKSFDFYQKSAKANPDYFWPVYNLGLLSFKNGQYEQAVSYFQQALAKDIKKNLYMVMQSKVYSDVRLSDNPKYNLLQSYTDASFSSYVFMLESYFRMKKYAQMYELSLLALKERMGQDEDIFYYYAGLAAFHQKALEQAVQLFELSLKSNPQNPEALYYLGQTLSIVGKDDLAKDFLARSAEMRQKNGSKIEQLINQGIKFF